MKITVRHLDTGDTLTQGEFEDIRFEDNVVKLFRKRFFVSEVFPTMRVGIEFPDGWEQGSTSPEYQAMGNFRHKIAGRDV